MIELDAIVFDWGNVISEPQLDSDIELMAAVSGLKRSQLENLYWQTREPYDRGDLTATEYWTGVAQLASTVFSPAQIEELTFIDSRSWSYPNQRVIAWINELRKSHLRLAVLSNMPLTLREYIELNCDWLPVFDHKVCSCDVRSIKPEAKIYEVTLHRLQSEPSRTLFIDDRAVNIEAALKLGFHGLVFTNLDDAIDELCLRFQLPLPTFR